MSNSVFASNLKRPETPLDRTDPHLIAAMAESLRAGGPNTFTAAAVTTPTVTGEARQRRDQRAAARAPQTSPATPAPVPVAERAAPVSLKPGQRVVLSAATRRRKPRPAPVTGVPFRPGVFPLATV